MAAPAAMPTFLPSTMKSMMPSMMMGMDDMDMDDMDMDMDDMDMGNMGMEMVMTFGDWKDYKLKLLFSDWDIKEKWQFALSWIAVMLAVVLYHALKYYEGKLEEHMLQILKNNAAEIEHEQNIKQILMGATAPSAKPHQTPYFLRLRVMHSLVAGIGYGVALMLMLVAMTYNPSLFVALMVGWVLGDFGE